MEAHTVKLVHRSSNTHVEFVAAPSISETGTTTYKSIDPVHSPSGINVYVSTTSRSFSVSSIKLISRNQPEATENYNRVQMLKSWRHPTFGATLEDDVLYGRQTLGAPPAVLELSAYTAPTSETGMANGLIYRVPVVISSLSIEYPTDCDYIPTVNLSNEPNLAHIPDGIPVPVIWTINMTLLESQAPSNLSQFSLTDLKRGKMVGF